MFKIYVVKSELRTEILKAFSCESAITDFEKTSTIDKEVVLLRKPEIYCKTY